jgi:antitoxin ParD1/3/4
MRNTQSLSITLPHDMAQMVKDKVASGSYASESEVIRDGLRALQARDAAIERWLHESVVPVFDRVLRGTKSSLTLARYFPDWNLVTGHGNRKNRPDNLWPASSLPKRRKLISMTFSRGSRIMRAWKSRLLIRTESNAFVAR